MVKGWAVERASRFLARLDDTDFCLSAGGDRPATSPTRTGPPGGSDRAPAQSVLAGCRRPSPLRRGRHLRHPSPRPHLSTPAPAARPRGRFGDRHRPLPHLGRHRRHRRLRARSPSRRLVAGERPDRPPGLARRHHDRPRRPARTETLCTNHPHPTGPNPTPHTAERHTVMTTLLHPFEVHGPHDFDGGFSLWPFLGGFFVVLILLAGLAALYLWSRGKLTPPSLAARRSPEDQAKGILADRFARGDISTEEFMERPASSTGLRATTLSPCTGPARSVADHPHQSGTDGLGPSPEWQGSRRSDHEQEALPHSWSADGDGPDRCRLQLRYDEFDALSVALLVVRKQCWSVRRTTQWGAGGGRGGV